MENAINPKVRIGHIHLHVRDLEKSLSFYRDLLGFEITTWYGDEAVFLSAGGYHHHIALNSWMGKEAKPCPPGHTGLYHFGIVYPSRLELAKAVKKLYEVNYPIDGASDHGVTESVYITDPDGNGVELYVDKPFEQWPIDSEGYLQMETKHIDLLGLLSELENE